MNRIIFYIVIIIFPGYLSLSLAQTIIPPGDVYGTWNINGSPYEIQGDITIPNDSTLLIEPGVYVQFEGYYGLNVQGRLLAIGTVTDWISFTVNDTIGFYNPDTMLGGWNGIQFIDTPAENDTSQITYCHIEYGKAVGSSPPENSGGAIFISNFNKVLISNCIIEHNSAGGSDSPSGGAISLHFASITLENNKISYNRAWDGGGVKIWESNPVFINNDINENYADEGGGGVWIGGISNCDFNGDNISHNFAGSNGGGILCWQTTNTTLNVVELNFNSANWGGGVGVIDCDMNIFNGMFVGNYATALGGGLASDFSTVYMYNTGFSTDSSGILSGAIHGWYSDMQIINSVFENNESDFGGAIHSDFSDIEINNSSFVGCKAIDGAAIHSLNTNLVIDSCYYSENSAVNIGGAIQYHVDTTEFSNKYNLNIKNSLFSGNSAFYRGAIEIQQLFSETSLVAIEIDKCEFNENNIDRGGNLLINGLIDDFVISNTIFSSNTAALRTAGCLFNGGVKGEVNNCIFYLNEAPGGSAASSVAVNSSVSFINCTFFNNSGAAALTIRNAANMNLINSILWKNRNYSIIVNAVTDSTPCTLNIFFSDIQYGMDSIIVNDSVSNINWGAGSFDEEPCFVDTSNNNFHLQNSSPCIGTGIDSVEIAGFWYYAPLIDIEGKTRPNPVGSMPDLGAYESDLGVSGLENYTSQFPKDITLTQNFPNPFNPQTSIKFGLPEASEVEITIFNSLGEKVLSLLNGYKNAGYHYVKIDASCLPSGIYFYRLQVGDFMRTKKMILIK